MTNHQLQMTNHQSQMKYHIFSPYRVCPLGAHVDHQHGLVSGFAIDKGVDLWFDITTDGRVDLTSRSFPGEVHLRIDDRTRVKEGNWGDYVRGAKYALGKRFELLPTRRATVFPAPGAQTLFESVRPHLAPLVVVAAEPYVGSSRLPRRRNGRISDSTTVFSTKLVLPLAKKANCSSSIPPQSNIVSSNPAKTWQTMK